ncbi:hypothetical protein RI129_010725 [Pyrocoelia pectoralis]|uniref:Uncharacterized protein n=1 Tax=Pyrocoelia pectoralis TaxID=417401 RepID=A0AAN7V9T6_9COLE
MDKPFELHTMDVFAQEDAVENFLAGEIKDDFNDDLVLSQVDDSEEIEFKSENVLDCAELDDDNVLSECNLNGGETVKDEKAALDYKRFRRNSLVNALKKRSIRCLNKMHVMEDVREGSDVPSAQPSSPGHAEQRPTIDETNEIVIHENNHETEDGESLQINGTESKSNDDLKLEDKPESLPPQVKEEVNSLPEDAASNDSENSKRKFENDESCSKRLRTLIEQNFVIRDKILNEYTDNTTTSSSTLQQIQNQMDQILSEIRVLNEELLLRVQRRKQIMTLTNDKIEWEGDGSPEHSQEIEDHVTGGERKLKNLANPNSGLVIYSTSQASNIKSDTAKKNSISKNLPSTVIEINGHSGDLRQNKQRPVLDVQSIIADYRQRHPEAVPRRGRRIRSILNNQGDSSMVRTTQGGGKTVPKLNDGSSQLETTSFKDVLMQFAKLSQSERQDIIQAELKNPPYSEVTVHPVPAHTQSTSNSLLHGILTKTQSRSDSKSTFSPTLARLLTAPERAAMSPHGSHGSTSLSVTDMLSNNKARNEITITPVGGQYDVLVKEKGVSKRAIVDANNPMGKLTADQAGMIQNHLGQAPGPRTPLCELCSNSSSTPSSEQLDLNSFCSPVNLPLLIIDHSKICKDLITTAN